MCEPTTLSIASLALVAAGTAATAYGANQASKAEGAATTAELDRQKKLRDEASKSLNVTIAHNDGKKTQTDMGAKAATREAAYSQSAADVANYAPAGQNLEGGVGGAGDRVVADSYAKHLGDASNYVKRQGAAQAALTSFDDTMSANNIFNANQGYDIRKLGSFMQGSAGVLPMELNAAGHAGDTSRTVGGILSALGAVTGAGAATGALGGAAAAAGASGSAGTAATVGSAGSTIGGTLGTLNQAAQAYYANRQRRRVPAPSYIRSPLV